MLEIYGEEWISGTWIACVLSMCLSIILIGTRSFGIPPLRKCYVYSSDIIITSCKDILPNMTDPGGFIVNATWTNSNFYESMRRTHIICCHGSKG